MPAAKYRGNVGAVIGLVAGLVIPFGRSFRLQLQRISALRADYF
jgi:hypothetical protein